MHTRVKVRNYCGETMSGREKKLVTDYATQREINLSKLVYFLLVIVFSLLED